jgi:hypothetical protein
LGQAVVTAAQVNGTWAETSGNPRGVSATFKIKALGGQKLQVEFRGNNAAAGFSNQVKGIAIIKGNTAIFKPAEAQDYSGGPCVITLKFIDGDLMVTETGGCGWGRGITAEGRYQKKIKKRG